jgi:large subunit ribosomal protein L15
LNHSSCFERGDDPAVFFASAGEKVKDMRLDDLHPAKGAIKKPKRVGRGPGSGHGKTSCRGHKGQKSGTGFSKMRGFEGGQMPLHRRIPKRGFTNIFRTEYSIVNVQDLERCFKPNEEVNPEALLKVRAVRKIKAGVKVLGKGEISKPLVVAAHEFSESAKKKIEAAGGQTKVLTK